MLGKENDPDNNHLIALCSGCHHIVTIVSGRKFAATPEAWEVLIQLVIFRKNGHNPDFRGVYTTVEIDMITAENEHLYAENDEYNS
jgi:pterin-4a-carbinolamine dehydratase